MKMAKHIRLFFLINSLSSQIAQKYIKEHCISISCWKGNHFCKHLQHPSPIWCPPDILDLNSYQPAWPMIRDDGRQDGPRSSKTSTDAKWEALWWSQLCKPGHIHTTYLRHNDAALNGNGSTHPTSILGAVVERCWEFLEGPYFPQRGTIIRGV